VEVREESWAEHRPRGYYDGIISVGAFEHFAKYMSSREEKVDLYREYFARCRSWLSKGKYMTLQILVYGTMKPHEQNQFIAHDVFPESELPYVHEVFEASEGLFEITDYRNDRMDYARTADLWLRNLQQNRDRILDLVGEDTYQRYDRYLKLTVIGFLQNRTRLARLQFQAI
jgi:cyclopropane-fatty-acyl-phospholipid synthase